MKRGIFIFVNRQIKGNKIAGIKKFARMGANLFIPVYCEFGVAFLTFLDRKSKRKK